MLFRAKDNRIRFLRGGKGGIFSMVLVEKESFSTLVSICNTAVSNLSNGGCYITNNVHRI